MDWADRAARARRADLDPDLAARTLGAVLKYREDTDRVRASGLAAVIGA